MELKGGGGKGAPTPPGQETKMSGTISPRDRLQLWVNTFLLKQKENSGSVTATFRDLPMAQCPNVPKMCRFAIN